MTRYTKSRRGLWNDRAFNGLSDDAKLGHFLISTSPHQTSVGAMRSTVPGLAAELGWTVRRFRPAFDELVAAGFVEADEAACYIGIPDFFELNRPESPNVVKAWAGVLELLPECELKDQLSQRLEALCQDLGEAFAKAFREAFAKGPSKTLLNQEQEQEQEREKGTRRQRERDKAANTSKVRRSEPRGDDPLQRLRLVAVGALKDSDRNPDLTNEQRARLCREVEAASTGPEIFDLYERETDEALT